MTANWLISARAPAERRPLRAVGEHEGTQMRRSSRGCLDQFSDAEIELFVEMSSAGGWTPRTGIRPDHRRLRPERVPYSLFASEQARKAGGRVVALTMPILTPMNMSRHVLRPEPHSGLGPDPRLPVPERLEKLRDPDVRAWDAERAGSKEAGASSADEFRAVRHRLEMMKANRG
ncbi:hypothetical protein SALBM311S_00792 [Streptomyces alboniger]